MEGFYTMTNEEYHNYEGISSTGIRKLLKSPAHYMSYLSEKKEPTKAMIFGTAFHTSILEPDEFNKIIAIDPDCDKRTKVGKEIHAAFEAANKGGIIISSEEFARMGDMTTAVNSHPEAKRILSSSNSVAEISGFWTSENGVKCKIRPDLLPGGNICVDLKTTQDASPEGFSREIAKYGYHIQAAFYLMGLTAITGEEHDTFVFIAVEKEPPYGVGVYYASHAMIHAGKEKVNHALNLYAECQKNNHWPCYSNEALEINFPRWAE